MTTFDQFTDLRAIKQFSMKPEKGRAICVKIGDLFTVTNPKHMQHNGIKIMRKNNARLNEGYLLDYSQILELFEVVQ